MKLFIRAMTKFILGLLLVGIVLFLPAGGFEYPNAWLFIALLFIPIFVVGVVLFLKAPTLLEKRLDAKEKETTQKGVVAIAGVLFIGGFVVAGLDFRFGWSSVPQPLVIAASIVLIVAYALYAEVMRENAYLSRAIEVQKGQRVVDTGLYAVVRHPMYAVTIWLFLAIPFVLGSFWSLLFFLPYVPVIAVRILNEEKILTKDLDGYAAYRQKVKYRLIPFVW